jgi:hypothetical protein
VQNEANTVRLLNLAGHSHDLLADSRVVVTVPASIGGCFGVYADVTSDGKSVIGPITDFNPRTQRNFLAFAEFSVSTHALTRIVQRQDYHGNANWWQFVLWPGQTGQVAIVMPAPGFGAGFGAEVLRGNSAIPLPWSRYTASAAW